MQISGNLRNQLEKKLILGPILVELWALKFLYCFFLNHTKQFKGKLMKQTWENDNKPNFGLGFGLFDPNMDPPNFSCEFYLY